MLLDCGLMFPEADMPGIDLVLPDFTYLRENADRIEGCVAHPRARGPRRRRCRFLLRDVSFPIYGSPLTLGLARNRIEEAGLLGRTELVPVRDGERRRDRPVRPRVHPRHPLGAARVRHAFHTPQGVILHSGDFKLDLTPVDGRRTDLARIGAIASRRASVCCCPTRPTPRSPATLRPSAGRRGAARPVRQHAGRRIITACFASHIHRIQQIADAAIACGRGRRHARAVDEARTCASARDLGLLTHPRRVARRHRGDRRTSARTGLRHLDRLAGRADVGAGAAGVGRQPLAQARRARTP